MPTRAQVIFLAVLALLTLGVVMVNSAGMAVTPVDPVTRVMPPGAEPVTMRSILTSRPALYALAALGALAIGSYAPLGWVDRLAGLGGRARVGLIAGAGAALAGLLLLVYVPGIGRGDANGADRWLGVPVVGSVQPSEIAKWAMVPLLAVGAVSAGGPLGQSGRLARGLLPLLAVLGVVSAVVVVEDLGTGVLIAGAGTALLIAAGARVWHLALLGPPAVAGLLAAVLTSPYRVDRVVSFIDPFADPAGKGFHMIQSMAAIAGGGVMGRGLGHGLQKFGYLPEDTTDFLFAIIAEELGVAGAALVGLIYAVLFAALAGAVRAARSPVLALVALGVLLTVAGQTMMNLFVVTGLGPTKGIALPLLSRGGTGWVLTAGSLGVVMAIARDATRGGQRPFAGREGA